MDKALLVGINKYPGNALNGCVNDIMDMAHFLVASRGFPQANIRLIVDGRATTRGIEERLRWLVAGARAGDRLFFHFSGHGTLFPKRSSSGRLVALQPAICPVDFDWSEQKAITSDIFHEIFASVPAGVEFVWVSDSCHSGDLEEDKPLALSMDPDVAGAFPIQARAFPMPADIQWAIQTAKGLNIAPSAAAPMNVALISGCQSNQTSADAYINGRYNGACTYYLLQELRRGVVEPLPTLVANMNAALRTARYEQIPGVEGASDIQSRAFLASLHA